MPPVGLRSGVNFVFSGERSVKSRTLRLFVFSAGYNSAPFARFVHPRSKPRSKRFAVLGVDLIAD